MKKLKETYGDASANASLLNKLTNGKKDGRNIEVKKKAQFETTKETALGLEDFVKLGN
jgi:hypothetical protein